MAPKNGRLLIRWDCRASSSGEVLFIKRYIDEDL